MVDIYELRNIERKTVLVFMGDKKTRKICWATKDTELNITKSLEGQALKNKMDQLFHV